MDITKDNYESEVLNSKMPVLVDFWAPWCGPCRIVGPIIEELGKELEGKVKVVKVNVDEQPELASKYSIMSIPTMKIFKDGQQVGEIIGAAPKQTIKAELDKHI